MLMIRTSNRDSHEGAKAALQQRNVQFRSISTTVCQPFGDSSAEGQKKIAGRTIYQNIQSAEFCYRRFDRVFDLRVFANICVHPMACPPTVLISATAPSSFFSSRPTNTQEAPSSANSREIADPRPDPPPVVSATRPARTSLAKTPIFCSLSCVRHQKLPL